MPFCHLQIKALRRPFPDNWIPNQATPAEPKTIGEHLKRRRLELHLLLRVILGFILGVVALIAAVVCVPLGSPAAAIAIGTSGVIGCVMVLANGENPSRLVGKVRDALKTK